MIQQTLSFDPVQFHPLFSDLNPRIVLEFFEYHKENPEIYELFKKFAHEARQRWNHFGAKAIFERIRWETDLKGGWNFKLNNNFPSAYARLLIFEDNSFTYFFELRRTPGTVHFEAA